MKNVLLSISIILLLTSCASTAQDIKVKGNREPTTEITVVQPFSTLEISEDFEVSILSGAQTQVELLADSNLHEFINFNNVGDKLTISSDARIRSARKMEFRITYGPELEKIIVRSNAQLSSVTKLQFARLDVKVQDDARLYMTAQIDELLLHLTGDSRSELNLRGESANIQVTDNADLKSLITYEYADITMKDRVDTRVEGDVNQGKLTLLDRISMKAKNLVFDDLELNASNNAKAEVNVKKNLIIQAEKDADITVYNSPKIELLKFEGKSILRKQ